MSFDWSVGIMWTKGRRRCRSVEMNKVMMICLGCFYTEEEPFSCETVEAPVKPEEWCCWKWIRWGWMKLSCGNWRLGMINPAIFGLTGEKTVSGSVGCRFRLGKLQWAITLICTRGIVEILGRPQPNKNTIREDELIWDRERVGFLLCRELLNKSNQS